MKAQVDKFGHVYKSSNKNPAVLNIIESFFLHQTEVDIKAIGHACKTVIKTNIFFPPITTLDCENLLKNN